MNKSRLTLTRSNTTLWAFSSLCALAAMVGCQTSTPRFISSEAGNRYSDYVESQSTDLRQSIKLASFEKDSGADYETGPAMTWLADEPTRLAQAEGNSGQESGRRQSSEPTSGLSLADLEAIAFQNNPTLMLAASRLASARGQAVQAGLYPNPVIGYHATEIGNLDTAGQQGAFVSQRIITGGKLQLDRAIAGRESDAIHFQFHAQELRVLSDVKTRFYEALVAQRRVALANELASIGERLVDATSQLLAGGQASVNDQLQAKIRAEESYILRDNSINEMDEAWRRLAFVLGVASLDRTPLIGELESPAEELDWDETLSRVLADHPSLAAARTRIDASRLSLQRALREPIPNVDFSVSHRHHNVTQDDVTNVQVGLPIPLFDRNQGNIQSRQADYSVAVDNVARLELEIQDRLARTHRRYENARQQVSRIQELLLPSAEESLQLATDGYQQGQVEYLTLLNAQQTFVQVNLSYLAALGELQVSKAAIDNQLLGDSLQESR